MGEEGRLSLEGKTYPLCHIRTKGRPIFHGGQPIDRAVHSMTQKAEAFLIALCEEAPCPNTQCLICCFFGGAKVLLLELILLFELWLFSNGNNLTQLRFTYHIEGKMQWLFWWG
jgi:hypothetical protein